MDWKILDDKTLQEQVEILQREIIRMEQSDYLTSLASRKGLYEYYNSLDKGQIIHMMFIEINNFKKINDVYGYDMGDNLLINVGELIKSCVNGFASRTEGNEFVVIIDSGMSVEDVAKSADKLVSSLADIDVRKDVLSNISLNVGVVLNQEVSTTFDELFQKGSTSLYQAKHNQ